MRPARATWGAVLALHLGWVALLPGNSGKVVAFAGAVIAAALLLFDRRGVPVEAEEPNTPFPVAAIVVPFLLPALSLVATPRVAFWVLNGRSWLIVAWLCAAVSLTRLDVRRRAGAEPGAPSVSPATLLAAIWSAAFWLALVCDLGVTGFVVGTDRTVYQSCQSDAFSTIFHVWETAPVRDHLFLGWKSVESFQQGTPYANHVHPYLLTMYGWSRAVRAATGLPQYVASNTIPFFYLAALVAAVTTLLARLGLLRRRSTVLGLTTLFLGYGLIVTGWRFWNDLFRYNTDNPYPLLAAAFILVYAWMLDPVRPVAAAASAAVFVALSPTHAPMAVVAVLVLFSQGAPTLKEFVRRNRVPLVVSATAVLVGAAVYLPPWLLSVWRGYAPVGSSVMFRSGLDGDTQYFSNMVQSVVAPCPRACCWGRSWVDLVYPALLPLLVLGPLARRAAPPVRLGHLLLFLCTPYLLNVILFPQSVSIHPYLYDHFLLIPAIVTGVVAMLTAQVEGRLRGVALLGFLLFCGWILMSNLVGIAQALAAMPPRP
jgi:hypothetical protein